MTTPDLTGAERVVFIGQRVTAERSSDNPRQWIVTGWEQGLPVCRRPITTTDLQQLCCRYPHRLAP